MTTKNNFFDYTPITEPVSVHSIEFNKKGLPDYTTMETITTNFQPVFCEKCEYYHHTSGHRISIDDCTHESNTIKKHTWLTHWEQCIKHPSKLNKNNDCPNYKLKREKKK